jgi:formylglycine-generating enzyme required for sulfatase activity
VDQAGGLSPYGVMGLGGNAQEWEESSSNLAYGNVSDRRGSRGGNWNSSNNFLSSSFRNANFPVDQVGTIGFRVASLSSSSAAAVPEPGTLLLGSLLGLGGYLGKRRMKK